MKETIKYAAYLLSMLALAAVPAFPASLEQTDTAAPAPARPTLTTAAAGDSAKPAVQVKKTDDNDDEDEDKEDANDADFHFRFEHPRHVIKSINRYTDSMSRRGYGCGGGPMAGVYAVNISPFKDLAARIAPLRGKNFSFGSLDYKSYFMSGGMGFVGVGNGLRLGGGGMSGGRHFPSSRFEQDSSVNYSTRITWGGFLIEKLVTNPKYSYIIGGYIGSGTLEADWVGIDNGYSAFSSYDNNDDDNIKAYFGFFELHTGVVYHIARFMHACGDLSIPVLVSSDGFAPWTKEFISISPGIRVRFIFGNLG